MEREIEFRAKMTKKPIGVKEVPWIYGSYLKHKTRMLQPLGNDKLKDEEIEHYMFFSGPADWGMNRELMMRRIDPETLGQYTGLKDIKGKKIYEGDIVSEKGHYVNSDKIVLEKIQWKETYSCWLRGEYRRLTPNNIKKYEITVVGNIYDDTELLEES